MGHGLCLRVGGQERVPVLRVLGASGGRFGVTEEAEAGGMAALLGIRPGTAGTEP